MRVIRPGEHLEYPAELWAAAFRQAAGEMAYPARGKRGSPENRVRQKLYPRVYRRALDIAKEKRLENDVTGHA